MSEKASLIWAIADKLTGVYKPHDPACGTGGMLSVAEEYLHKLNVRTGVE